uniref:Death associated protein n=1 Tax=Salvator merianae TaxID=96440 RepID=A0A8D0DRG0_SALMN
MSSPPKVKAETRAGHPPAVKAGGMRIVQKHPHAVDAKEEKDKDEQDWESGSGPPKPTVFISGVIARGDKDFPPAAAQYHSSRRTPPCIIPADLNRLYNVNLNSVLSCCNKILNKICPLDDNLYLHFHHSIIQYNTIQRKTLK